MDLQNTIELISDLLIIVGGVAAIVYGYTRWREYKYKGELWWCTLGVVGLLGCAWDYASRHLLVGMLDPNLLHWSRQLVYIAVFMIVLIVAKRTKIGNVTTFK